MSYKIDLHATVDKLAKQVSKKEVARILWEYEVFLEPCQTKAITRNTSKLLTVIDKRDVA